MPTVPTRDELEAARSRSVPDVLGPGLVIVFVGINPGLFSAAVGHHFARPGNRFWKALYLAGITDRIWVPSDDRELLSIGIGITNIVGRPTATAAELSAAELREGRRALGTKIRRFRPAAVAILGVTAYRTGFERSKASLGLQDERFEGAGLWVLPNPSGLNAHHQLPDLADAFARLRTAVADAT
ncbi:MAG: G/U mismatch-specific DNA glycosylase [Actinobacteria bacterium]|nr:MAG: G/U mismatch-specific DNA glycosylase [Actinomycetota bacterium]